jgi:hypothetical protein
MTLNQFYDEYTRQNMKKSWNVYCAETTKEQREYLKKNLKRIYKQIVKETKCQE